MSKWIDGLQGILNYQSTGRWNPQFRNSGAGMMGTTGFLLGLCGGVHFGILLALLLANQIGAIGKDMSEYFVTIILWSVYVTLLCLFHFLEFFSTALWQPKVLSYDSFIVNHSRNYTIAMIVSATEYWLESYLCGNSKRREWISWLGLTMVLGGQIIRTVAMWTCDKNFSHQIMVERTEGHQLVTHGIYRYLRHPSYFGWFYWSVGTQILLCNPISFCFFTYASWTFFNSRIPYEEETLLEFYQQEYVDYCLRTFIGIPFIRSVTNNGGYTQSRSSE